MSPGGLLSTGTGLWPWTADGEPPEVAGAVVAEAAGCEAGGEVAPEDDDPPPQATSAAAARTPPASNLEWVCRMGVRSFRLPYSTVYPSVHEKNVRNATTSVNSHRPLMKERARSLGRDD